MISLKKFKNYKNILEDNISNSSFRGRLLYEAIDDELFADEILDYIRKLSNKDISAKDLDSVFKEIRNKTITCFDKAHSEDDNKSLKYCMRSLAYYYFLECMDEYSNVSENIVKQIKEKYPENYMEVISQADKIYLSADMRDKIESKDQSKIINDDIINKYLVLKKWQDRQHFFFEGEYWNDIEKIHLKYLPDKNLSPFQLEQESLKKRLFSKLSEQRILDIDTCSIISELYIKNDVVKFIGGKMYGLAVLNSNEIPVPYSVVVPTNVDVTESDLKMIDSKYDAYSIRSSADIEDGNKHSFAGMFDSFLNVKRDDIISNINKVKKSVNNERVKDYIKLYKMDNPHMAEIIQAFKEPSFAGVWIGNSSNSGILEYVNGNGEKLVSGSDTPTTEVWKENNTEGKPFSINGIAVGRKMLEYQTKTGCNSDFEWMILDGELIMLQFRPVTKTIDQEITTQKDKNAIYGTPASAGIITGKGNLLISPDEKLKDGEILLTRMTSTSWIPNLMKAKGAVTARGGFLCHTAIICRELGIPCVTGVGMDALKELAEYERIKIDGNTGKVEESKCIEKGRDDDE